MLIVCIVFGAGVLWLLNDMFPKAKPVQHPEMDEIVSVTLSCNTTDGDSIMNEVDYEELIRYIRESKPIRQQSWDDCPSVRPYYCIKIQTDERQYRFSVYESAEQVYIESPYEGVYESQRELLELVLKYNS